MYNTGTSCTVTLPSITRSGWTIVGYGENSSATTKKYAVSANVSMTANKTTSLDDKTRTCTIYNTTSSCSVTLPYFNKTGSFNGYWSTSSNVSQNLKGTTWSSSYFKRVGESVSISANTNFYPNFNHYHYDLNQNYYKYRSFSVSKTITKGSSIFEYQSGIPTSAITAHETFLNTAYSKMKHLFVPGKAFVMTYATYASYSTAYGLTHDNSAYFFVDLKYDSNGDVVKNAIDENATLHELGHAWDYYYNYRTGKGLLRDQTDFMSFYNSLKSAGKLSVDSSGAVISNTELFAAMVTNYYWHVLNMNTSKQYYGLKSGMTLSTSEKSTLKTIMEKYINISNNGYK